MAFLKVKRESKQKSGKSKQKSGKTEQKIKIIIFPGNS
jgi:hypothetical protein